MILKEIIYQYSTELLVIFAFVIVPIISNIYNKFTNTSSYKKSKEKIEELEENKKLKIKKFVKNLVINIILLIVIYIGFQNFEGGEEHWFYCVDEYISNGIVYCPNGDVFKFRFGF